VNSERSKQAESGRDRKSDKRSKSRSRSRQKHRDTRQDKREGNTVKKDWRSPRPSSSEK